MKVTRNCSVDDDHSRTMYRRRFPTLRRRDDLVALSTTSRAHQTEFRQVSGVQATPQETDGG